MAKSNSNTSDKKSFKTKWFDKEYVFTLGKEGEILCNGKSTEIKVQGGDRVLFNDEGMWFPLQLIQSNLGIK